MYNHTQPGVLMNLIMGAAVIMAVIVAMVGKEPGALLIGATLALVLALYTNLNVQVDKKITVTFGIGVFKKRFKREDIKQVEIVENSWWYGFGMRMIPNGWMWNVSGLDAVELLKKNGRVFRIGTDDADGLYVAIEKWLKKQ